MSAPPMYCDKCSITSDYTKQLCTDGPNHHVVPIPSSTVAYSAPAATSTLVPMEDIMKELKDMKKGQEDMKKGQEDMKKGQEDVKKGQADLKRTLESQQQVPSIAMSDAGSDKNWSIIEKAGFTLSGAEWPPALTQSLLGEMSPADFLAMRADPFLWDVDHTEKAQEKEYMEFLGNFVALPRDSGLLLERAPNNLLDLVDERLGFKLTGTSDAIIIDKAIEYSTSITDLALRALFELKKAVKDRDVKQAAAQLISSAIKAQFSSFVVLTDLRDDWRFLSLEGRRTIVVMRAPPPTAEDPHAARRCASLLLTRLLASASSNEKVRQSATLLLEAAPAAIAKRQKLSPIKEHRGSRSEEAREREMHMDKSDEDDDDVDGSGWDEEDRQLLLMRQVRVAIRHTPWLREVCRPSTFAPMSVDARGMFG